MSEKEILKEEVLEMKAKEEAYKIGEEHHTLISFHAVALFERNFAAASRLTDELKAIEPRVGELWECYYRAKLAAARARKVDFLAREGTNYSKFELDQVHLPRYDKEVREAEQELASHLKKT